LTKRSGAAIRRTRDAKARASAQEKAGKLSEAQKDRIDHKVDRVLDQAERVPGVQRPSR